MIAEWFEYLTTPCPWSLRRMGYLRESIGIRSRYRRHTAAWAEHLDNSKRVIRAGIEACSDRRKAVIFGAGLVYDLPLEDLSAAFDDVLLVDLVHLRPARRAAARWSNVALVTADLTASLEGVYRGQTDVAAPQAFLDDATVDYVVSANVASQLAVLPVECLRKRFGLGEDAGRDLGAALVQAHLDYLGRFNCPALMISDQTRIWHDGQGREVQRDDALYGLELPPSDESWSWAMAPLGEVERRYSVTNTVVATRI